MKLQIGRRTFCRNQSAVLGLPLQVTVSLILGTIVLCAILSFMLNPCLFPEKMIVSVTPMVNTISNTTENVTLLISVHDLKGHPIQGAWVLIQGLGGAAAEATGANGSVLLHIQVRIPGGVHEGYLTVKVKAGCHAAFEQDSMVKIVKSEA